MEGHRHDRARWAPRSGRPRHAPARTGRYPRSGSKTTPSVEKPSLHDWSRENCHHQSRILLNQERQKTASSEIPPDEGIDPEADRSRGPEKNRKRCTRWRRKGGASVQAV